MYAECHKRYLQHATTFLRCKVCGRFHLGAIWPVTSLDEEGRVRRWVKPVTCPHCGKKNCAGPRKSFSHCPRGTGKTELQKLVVAYFIGYCKAHGYTPECMVVCQNQDEAKKRLAMVHATMLMNGHQACFPESVPNRKPPGVALKMKRESNAVLMAYGIDGVPPGFHGDLIWADDVCNMNNTMLKPSMMPKVIEKWENVVEYSQQPWTILAWDSTPWRENDLDHKLEMRARANIIAALTSNAVLEWSFLYDPWADDNPIYNEDGVQVLAPFQSLWPEKWTPEALQALFEADPIAYQRAIRLKRIADHDVAFQRFHFWVPESAYRKDCPPAIMQNIPVMGEDFWKDWPIYAAIDAGFTGADAKDKKGRSKTGVVIGAVDPVSKNIFTLWGVEEYVAAGDHLERFQGIFEQYKVRTVALEIGAALSEVVRHFEKAGYIIDRYNPSDKIYGGSKEMRKMALAQDVNQGRFLFMGCPQFGKSSWKIDGSLTPQWSIWPASYHKPLVEACLVFPAEKRDLLDAMEMLCRTARKFHGFNVKINNSGKKDLTLTDEQKMLEEYTRNLGRPPAEPMIPGDLGAVFSEIGLDLEAEFSEMGLLD
jgi:hypothetical protein